MRHISALLWLSFSITLASVTALQPRPARAQTEPRVKLTWLGEASFMARSVYFQRDEASQGTAIFISSKDLTCDEVSHHRPGPDEGTILLALQNPLETVQFDGDPWQFYPVFMSGPEDMSAYVTLDITDAQGNSVIDQPQGPMDVVDKEGVGQHGTVRTRLLNDATALKGFFDVYYGGLAHGRPRRVWGEFTATPCKFM